LLIFQCAGQIDIHEHGVAGTARSVGKQPSGAAQPPGAQRWLAAHEEHAGQVNRLHRRAVHVPLLEIMPMQLLRERQALRDVTKPPCRVSEPPQVVVGETSPLASGGESAVGVRVPSPPVSHSRLGEQRGAVDGMRHVPP
jgi:hypothetical protein